jgi:hypothetical protein
MRLTKLALGILAIVVCLGPNNLYAESQAIRREQIQFEDSGL